MTNGDDEKEASPGGPAESAWVAIDHVQVAIPVGGEDVARRFYCDVLGFSEIPKPAVMAARGGAWFATGGVQLHVGAEQDFVPARKAHPALVRRGLREFVVSARLDATWSDEIPGTVRCHVHDPFGNRIELIDAGLDARSDADPDEPTGSDA